MTKLSLDAPRYTVPTTAPWQGLLPLALALALALAAMGTPKIEDPDTQDQTLIEADQPQTATKPRVIEDWRGNSASIRRID